MTRDPAMLLWLDGYANHRWNPNENYARELMELFTLGADRGAYTEADIRELARALTGWTVSWNATTQRHENFRFDVHRYDPGTKTVWAGTAHRRSGSFTWHQACDLCLESPYHRSYLVARLWSHFVPTPPDDATRTALEDLYVDRNYDVRALVEAILLHPDLHTGEAMVKPPVVYAAGLLRARGAGITTKDWYTRCERAAQVLFQPPNVAGWDEERWLDTSTFLGRWTLAGLALEPAVATAAGYAGVDETPEAAVAAALAFWGDPPLRDASRSVLLDLAAQARPVSVTAEEWRAQRQNVLRHLIATAAENQVS